MQEGTLTWGLRRNSLSLLALQAQGPSGRIAFWRFIFALFVLMFFVLFLHVLLMDVDTSIWVPCWRHFPCFLHYFFENRFYMDLLSILQANLYIVWSISVDFRRPTSNWRNPQKHLFLDYFCIVYTFANTCFFINSETCFAAVCLHNLLLYFAPMLASFWYDLGIKTEVFSIPIF